ncbi:PAS domain-containing sensor histidine kinase [Pararhodospirillum oryzae]|uniref:histidine kinase n=1 Tax=Pararhodospirillum oryzae TaxID=478448 RepID=A0A512H380_9PROT|nr:ATP-binding protein [Pararhodospirillum oryzae]GEO79919.1 hypothetical protein ROR02_00500 [Pararhodospirillum oryzae]
MSVRVVYVDAHDRIQGGEDVLSSPSWLGPLVPGSRLGAASAGLDDPGFAEACAWVRETGQTSARLVRAADESETWVQVVIAPLPFLPGGLTVTFTPGVAPNAETERLAGYLDAIPESLVVVTNEGRIVYVNQPWIEFGCANGGSKDLDWRGINYLEVCKSVKGVDQNDADHVRDGLRAVLEGRLSYFEWEYPCHSPTEERWFLMQATPLRRGSQGVVISHLNITSRILAEKRAQLADTVLEASGEAVLVTTADERIIRVNPAFTALTGFTPEEVVGETPRVLSSGYHDKDFYRDFWNTLKNRGFWHGEMWNKRKSGEVYPELITINEVRDKSDDLVYYVGLFSDISTLKAKETQLKSINDELEQFAYAISHDLRQPLRMVKSYLQLLVRRMGHGLGTEAGEFVREATQGADRMDRLIEDLLDYARCGREMGTPAVVALETVLTGVAGVLAPALAEIDAQLFIRRPLPCIWGNESAFERVFQNLVGNAVKYRDRDRPLKIDIKCVVSQGMAVVSVRDNGIGIDAADRKKVFSMFYRLQAGAARAAGAGMGLAVCKKLIEQQSGSIEVRGNEDGPGCTFVVSLPLAAGLGWGQAGAA